MDRTSIFDDVAKNVAPVLRRLQDININVTGTKCKVLRITIGEKDSMGDHEDSLYATVINNAIITHPYGSSVQIYENYNPTTMLTEVTAMDIYEFLPITMKIPFNGDIDEDQVEVKRGDIIVQVLFDDKGNKIPLVMQVTRILADFMNKHIVVKKYEMTLLRNEMEPMIKDAIQEYISNEELE